MRATLSATLSDAGDDGIIMANPAFGLGRRKASRADRLTSAERIQKVRPMSWEQRDAFLSAVKNPRSRRSSSCSPRWGFARARPSRSSRVTSTGGSGPSARSWNLHRIKPTKTYEERTVDLSPDLLRSLERHVAWLRRRSAAAGASPSGSSRMTKGKPHDESRVRKFHKKGLKDAKLPSFRLYDLRHTYASLLLAAGAPITYVSA
jgi:hypothetical protein